MFLNTAVLTINLPGMSQESTICDTVGVFKQMGRDRKKFFSDPGLNSVAARADKDLTLGSKFILRPYLEKTYIPELAHSEVVLARILPRLKYYLESLTLLKAPNSVQQLKNLIINAKKKVTEDVLDGQGNAIPSDFAQNYLEVLFYAFKVGTVDKSAIEYVFNVSSTHDDFKLIYGFYNFNYFIKVCETGGDYRPQHTPLEYEMANPVDGYDVKMYHSVQRGIKGELAELFTDPNIGVAKSVVISELLKETQAASVRELLEGGIQYAYVD